MPALAVATLHYVFFNPRVLNSAFNGEKPRSPGLGGMLIDKDHNLPPSGSVQHNINYKSIYRKAWGVA